MVAPAEATRSLATSGEAGAELDVPPAGSVGPGAGGDGWAGVVVGVVCVVEPPGPGCEDPVAPPCVVSVKS